MKQRRDLIIVGDSAANIDLNKAAQVILQGFELEVVIILAIGGGYIDSTFVGKPDVSKELRNKLQQEIPDLTIEIIKDWQDKHK